VIRINKDNLNRIGDFVNEPRFDLILEWFEEDLQNRILKLINSKKEESEALKGECRLLQDVIRSLKQLQT